MADNEWILIIAIALVLSAMMVILYYFVEKESHNPPSYTACGCGCCENTEPVEKCLYKIKGESLSEVREKDKTTAQNPDCENVGCSQPIKYVYCD